MPLPDRRLSGSWKALGGLVRAEAAVEGGTLSGVRITGDFFVFPPKAVEELERALEGVAVERGALEAAASSVLDRVDVEAVGLGPRYVANAFLGPQDGR